ncbi:hypothetical protein [Actinomadura fibrosa]|uniref:hypothetical protein n=1 Tax=Actinomadura fibrosa TaxID=111802 RepID=UPI001041A384|nr:hypothetical protein [Actinomadura fibrosa]
MTTTDATGDAGSGGAEAARRLLGAARELAEIAHALRETSAHATAALTDPRVGRDQGSGSR